MNSKDEPEEYNNIFGLENSGAAEGEAVNDPTTGVVDSGEGKECLICLTEEKNTIVMPCGHLCVCKDCGKQLFDKKFTCPVCRGNIGSLIPFSIKQARRGA